MANTSSLVFAGIAPHPPIMVPEVGRESTAEVRSSIDAMAELAERLTASGAETLVIISPHAPLDPAAFVAYEGPQLYGDFANFRAPTASTHAQLDAELLSEITRAAAGEKLEVLRIRGFDLDHGTLVPLYFLQKNGWQGRLVALGYSFLSNEEHVRFGNCIRQAIDKIGRSVGFVASGDLSHRLRPEAPAGYHPQAHLFDEEVVDAIRTCSTSRIVNIDHELRRTAGECGFRSMLVGLGVAQGLEPSCEVISYEAPFGVGYMVAQLVSAGTESRPVGLASGSRARAIGVAIGSAGGRDPQRGSPAEVLDPSAERGSRAPSSFGAELPALARLTVETLIKTGTVITPPDNASDLLKARAACFVTIKTHSGDLRGCIGTIEPASDTLAGSIVPMQPRRSPLCVLIVTKQAARALRRSEALSGGVMTVPVLMRVSTVRRARAGSSAPKDDGARDPRSADGSSTSAGLPRWGSRPPALPIATPMARARYQLANPTGRDSVPADTNCATM